MNVSHDVEWSVLMLPVVPERLLHDLGRVYIFGSVQYVNMPEALALKISEGAAQVLRLVPYHVRTEASIRPRLVSVAQMRSGRFRAIATGRT